MKIANRLLMAASIIIVGGCAHDPSRYYGMVDTDKTLERRLRSELDSHPNLASISPNVLISAQNGTVTLSGVVPNPQKRQEIDAIVRDTSGVVAVKDQLLPPAYTPTGTYGRPARIYSSPPELAPAPEGVFKAGEDPGLKVHPATEFDRHMAQQVADHLRAARLPPGSLDSVAILVSGQVATVQGTVSNEDERQGIIAALEQTGGIKAVHDQLLFK